MKKIFLLFCMLVISMNTFAAEKTLKIVTSTTLFAELMRQIGGEHVKVESIASPKFNIHFIQPTPNDVRKTAHADLFVFAGLDLEAWVDPLLEAAGNPKLFRGGERNLDLSEGVSLLKVPTGNLTRAAGDLHLFGNPHYVTNPENARIMAQTVSKKLQTLDPGHAAEYAGNETEFVARLDLKIAEWKQICAHCSGKEVFSYHDDIVYLTNFLGIKEGQYLESKPGVPPAPKHLAELESYAQKNNVKVIATASYYSRGQAEKLAKRIHAKVAVIAQGSGEVNGTENIFDFYEYNVKTLAGALE